MKDFEVAVVDDDVSIREALADLLATFGCIAKVFASAEQFLASDVGGTDCLILDVSMPGMSGPELRRELKRRGHDIPIIFITAQRQEAIRVSLSEPDVVTCLFKPFSDTDLQDALKAAFRRK